MVERKPHVFDLLCVGVGLQEVEVVLESDAVCPLGGPKRRALSERLLLQGLDRLPWANLMENSLVNHTLLVIDEVDEVGEHDVEGLRGRHAASVLLLLIEVELLRDSARVSRYHALSRCTKATKRAPRSLEVIDATVRPLAHPWSLGAEIPAVVFCEVVLHNLPVLLFCELGQKEAGRLLARAGRELVKILHVLQDIDAVYDLVVVIVRDHLLGFVCLAQFQDNLHEEPLKDKHAIVHPQAGAMLLDRAHNEVKAVNLIALVVICFS